MIIGYARVSTNDQDLSSQLEALKQAGATKIYREKISGARSDRPELAKLMKTIGHNDVLIVTRLDRLARSTRDLLNVLADVTKAGGAFKSLADTWADSTTPHGRLMLTVLGGLAEFERELTRARTGEGRKRAQANGVKFGRPMALSPHQQAEILSRRANGETLSVLAASYGVNRKTILRSGSV
jgi:DNA invertase Pin-like site-specific DNA recombinase